MTTYRAAAAENLIVGVGHDDRDPPPFAGACRHGFTATKFHPANRLVPPARPSTSWWSSRSIRNPAAQQPVKVFAVGEMDRADSGELPVPDVGARLFIDAVAGFASDVPSRTSRFRSIFRPVSSTSNMSAEARRIAASVLWVSEAGPRRGRMVP